LIATAGTAQAARNLVKKLGGEIVECAFIIELIDLRGRDKLKGENVYSVVEFED
jgi:adenine phosphoribosyltransferase